jgi:hypothetical protein
MSNIDTLQSKGMGYLLRQIPEPIAYLILLYLHGELTLAERQELDKWIRQSDENEKILEQAINI